MMIVLMLYTFLSPYSPPPPPPSPSSPQSHYQTFHMSSVWYIPFPLMHDDDTFSSVFRHRLYRHTAMWLFSPPILWQPATMLPKIRKIKRIICNYLFRLRALSKSQNWPARPWPNQTFWQWNMLFPRGFAEKPSPLCIIVRIWLIWMVSFD